MIHIRPKFQSNSEVVKECSLITFSGKTAFQNSVKRPEVFIHGLVSAHAILIPFYLQLGKMNVTIFFVEQHFNIIIVKGHKKTKVYAMITVTNYSAFSTLEHEHKMGRTGKSYVRSYDFAY